MGKMGQGKKRSKSYYRKSGANYRKQDRMLQVGMKGILITCAGNEARCVKEAYNLLNEYADQLYGPEKCADETEDVDGEDDSEEDISDLLEKEVNALKEQHTSKDKRFRSARTGAKNVIFIQTTGIDPTELMHHMLTDLEKTKTQKARNIQRMVPVSHTCKAFDDKIEKTAQEMIYPVFLAADAKDSTFCVMFKARNNNKIKKEPIIQLLAPIVLQGSTHIHKVDFDAPDYTVMVNVLGSVCCLSILRDYNRFKKYNLHFVAGAEDAGVSGDGKRKRTEGTGEEEEEEEDVKKLRVEETEEASRTAQSPVESCPAPGEGAGASVPSELCPPESSTREEEDAKKLIVDGTEEVTSTAHSPAESCSAPGQSAESSVPSELSPSELSSATRTLTESTDAIHKDSLSSSNTK